MTVRNTTFYMFAEENGFNPAWDETCEFTIIDPALAFISFVVDDLDMFSDVNFIGQGTYPVCSYCVFCIIRFLFF